VNARSGSTCDQNRITAPGSRLTRGGTLELHAGQHGSKTGSFDGELMASFAPVSWRKARVPDIFPAATLPILKNVA
jgi:hypothetical protein